MPIYEYVCNQCGNRFEEFTWSSAAGDDIVCPKCGATDARKVMSAFGIGRAASGSTATAPACGPVG